MEYGTDDLEQLVSAFVEAGDGFDANSAREYIYSIAMAMGSAMQITVSNLSDMIEEEAIDTSSVILSGFKKGLAG